MSTDREDDYRSSHSRKIKQGYASSNTYSKIIHSSNKNRNRYVDYLRDISKHTCLIHGTGIHRMNARSWGDLVLSILKSGLLRTAGMNQQLKINLTESNITMLLLIMQWMRSYFNKIIK